MDSMDPDPDRLLSEIAALEAAGVPTIKWQRVEELLGLDDDGED